MVESDDEQIESPAELRGKQVLEPKQIFMRMQTKISALTRIQEAFEANPDKQDEMKAYFDEVDDGLSSEMFDGEESFYGYCDMLDNDQATELRKKIKTFLEKYE